MSFYLTLPSTTSFDFFPDNTAGQFTTKLPQPINLKEDFEVGLSEIQFNSSYINVSEDACFVDYKNAEENEKTRIRIIPGMFSNNEDFIKIINERIQQDYGFEDITFSYDKMTRRVTVRVSNKATIKLSPNLARLLGFKNPKINGPHQRYAQSIMDLNEDYHSIFVYCDIVSPNTVGDAFAPLLRIVPTFNRTNPIVHHTYQTPHYFPVSRKNFNQMEILLKNHLGKTLSFGSGQTIVTLHFRPRQN